MKAWFWRAADWLAHLLYCPAMLGRRIAVDHRAHWRYNIHLIPGWVLGFVCDRYDLALGVTKDELGRTSGTKTPAEDEFAEFDMTEDEFDAAFANGEPVQIVVPIGYRCEHMNITSTPGVLRQVTAWCGCKMEPIFA